MKSIRESFECIEPRKDAKERMLGRIYEKAERKKRSRKRLSRLALPVAACLCFAAVGTVAYLHESELKPALPPTDTLDGVATYARVVGPDAFEAYGMVLEMPDSAANAEYAILNGAIASAEFELDGHTYYLRAGVCEEDVSGFSPEEAQEIGPADAEYHMVRFSAGLRVCHKLTWELDGAFYYLTNTDGASPERLVAVYRLLRDAQM